MLRHLPFGKGEVIYVDNMDGVVLQDDSCRPRNQILWVEFCSPLVCDPWKVTLSKHLVSSAVSGDTHGSCFLGLLCILNETTHIKAF